MAEIIQSNPNPSKEPIAVRIIIILIVILLALVAGIIYWHNRGSGNGRTSSNKYSYRYDKASPYTLTGKSQGAGIILNKPEAFGSSPVAKTDDSITFVQLATSADNKSAVATGFLALRSRLYPKLLGITYKESVKKAIQNRSGEEYSNAVLMAEQIEPQVGIYGQKITLGKAKPFTNSNIKNYGWQFDATATDIYNKGPIQQGKVIYILGQKAWYYTLLITEKNNWQNNSAFFQKVLDSLNVDQ
jgi:hypothetical protein